ncbi:MAG: recombinase RarA, partial [Limosilactobacillus oris]
GKLHLTLPVIEDSVQKKALTADKDGDAHYDVISAFQKSIRGSDVDAALHYLARLIEAGDLTSIVRRLMVIAYEDIGLANMPAVQRAVTAVQAAQQVGLPEARIPLADVVIELCLSPKSNSGISAIDRALTQVKQGGFGDVPAYLKDAHYKGAAKLGHGVDYQFPHDHPQDWVAQQYLPDRIKDAQYFQPKQNGRFEQALGKQYWQLRRAQRQALSGHHHPTK